MSLKRVTVLVIILVTCLAGLVIGCLTWKSREPRSSPPLGRIAAVWKTYTNKHMAFSISYPLNLYLKEEMDHGTPSVIFSNQSFATTRTPTQFNTPLSFDSKTYAAAEVSTMKIIKTLPFDRSNLENDAMQRSIPPVPLKKIVVNGMKALATNPTVTNIAMIGETTTRNYYLRANDGDIYVIIEYVGKADKNSESVFSSMLSSFALAD